MSQISEKSSILLTLSNRLWVPEAMVKEEDLSHFRYRFIREDYSTLAQSSKDPHYVEIVESFIRKSNLVGFPRGNLGKLNQHFLGWEDKREIIPVTPPLRLTSTLRGDQLESIRGWVKFGYGLIEAPTGWGKTVTLYGLISYLRQKTLVLIHTLSLLEQWVSEGYKHTNAMELDRRGNRRSIGIYSSSKDAYSNVTIATYESFLYKRGIEWLQRNRFGLLIVDEAHKAAANTFFKVVSSTNTYYRCGATATPTRKDGCEVLIYDLVGPVVVKATAQQMTCDVVFHEVTDPAFVKWISVLKVINWARLLNKLVASPTRNSLILEAIYTDIKSGRHSLILTDRIRHALFLSDEIRRNFGPISEVITKATGRKQRDEIFRKARSGKILCVISTPVTDAGVDVPIWDSLHMTCPSANEQLTEQRAGRIRRFHPRKTTTVIHDYLDAGHSILYASKKIRERVYHRLGFHLSQGPSGFSEISAKDF